MKINEFCQEANQNPMFDKNKGGLQTEITPKLLREIGFSKKDYQIPSHLLELYHLIAQQKEEKRKEEAKKRIIESKKLTPEEEKVFEEIIDILHARKWQVVREEGKIKLKEGVKISSDLPLIRVLRLIPQFNQEVLKIRKKYKLIPKRLLEELHKTFPENQNLVDSIVENKDFHYLDELLFRDKHFAEYYKDPEQFHKRYKIPFAPLRSSEMDLIPSGVIKELFQTRNEIENWEKKKFSNLYQETHVLRCKLRLSKEYFRSLKNYILYGAEGEGFCKDWHIWSGRKDIEIEAVASPLICDMRIENFEPYVEIKVYWDANVSKIKTLLKSIKEEQKKLPNYKMRTLIRNTPGENLQTAICYWLRKGAGLSYKRANNLLEKLGYKKKILSRDLKRFEELLGL